MQEDMRSIVALCSRLDHIGFVIMQGGKAGTGAKCELKTVEVCNAVPAEPFGEWQNLSFMRWHNAACMTVPRACLAAATLHSTLYAAGGQSGRVVWDTVEAYDPHHDSWSAVAAAMQTGRKYTSAGVLHGRHSPDTLLHCLSCTACCVTLVLLVHVVTCFSLYRSS